MYVVANGKRAGGEGEGGRGGGGNSIWLYYHLFAYLLDGKKEHVQLSKYVCMYVSSNDCRLYIWLQIFARGYIILLCRKIICRAIFGGSAREDARKKPGDKTRKKREPGTKGMSQRRDT